MAAIDKRFKAAHRADAKKPDVSGAGAPYEGVKIGDRFALAPATRR